MKQSSFADIVTRLISTRCPGQAEAPVEGLIYLPNDSVISLIDDELAIFGFGVASGMKLTQDLVSAVAKINRQSRFGACWIANGAADGTLSIVFGIKFFYGLSDPVATEAQIQTIYDSVPSLRIWYQSYLQHLNPAAFLAQVSDTSKRAFALVSYLG